MYVEVDIWAALAHDAGTLNGQDLLASLILDDKPRSAECPLLLHHTDHVPGGRLDLQLIKTAIKGAN